MLCNDKGNCKPSENKSTDQKEKLSSKQISSAQLPCQPVSWSGFFPCSGILGSPQPGGFFFCQFHNT